MKNRGILLLLCLGALLVLVLIGAQVFGARQAATDPELLLEAVMNRAGVTRWSEAVDWYSMEEEGALAGEARADTPVWVASLEGKGAFHANPLCGHMRAPQRLTLAEALLLGRAPCSKCWE